MSPPGDTPRDRKRAAPEHVQAAAPAVRAEPPRLGKGTRDDVSGKAAAAGLHEDVASLVHDLKNPLTAILLELRVLDEQVAEQVPAIRPRLERLAHNAIYVERLVGDLLDLVASDEGKLELRRERVDLADLVRETVERSVPPGERRRVRIDIRSRLVVVGDALRLERVIANLVDNALKHTPAGTPLAIRLEQRDDWASVSVADRGVGLTAEQVDACFERFGRGPSDHAGHGPSNRAGHGLGLYVCRCILEAHRGRIGVESAPGKGARFYFLLPLA